MVATVDLGRQTGEGAQAVRGRPRWLLPAAGGLAVLATAVVVLKRLHGVEADDSFISYRYAANIAAGHGWVYDLHRHTTDAATSPLYTLVLSLAATLGLEANRAGSVLFVLAAAASSALAYALCAGYGRRATGVVAAILLLTCPWFAATRGMETELLVVGALGLAVAAQRTGASALTGVTASLLALTRGEGIVLGAVLLALAIAKTRRVPWRSLVGFAGTLAAWAIIALALGASVVPDTLGAKIAQGRSGFWGTGFIYVAGVRQLIKAFDFTTWIVLVAIAALGGLLACVRSSAARAVALPISATAVVVFLAYGYVLNPPPYHWYYGFQLLALVLLASCGIGWLAERGVDRQEHVLIGIAAILTGVVATAGFQAIPRGFSYKSYVDTASWLRGNTPATATVAASEIGVLGYYAHRDIIDYLGLLSTASVHDLDHKDLTTWVMREEPDYWVVHSPSWGFERPVTHLSWFDLAFKPVHETGGVVVFKRRMPVSEAQRIARDVLKPRSSRILAASFPTYADSEEWTESVDQLISVVCRRPDIGNAYLRDPMVNIQALAAWAAGPGSTTDIDAPSFVTHQPVFAALAGNPALASGPSPTALCAGLS